MDGKTGWPWTRVTPCFPSQASNESGWPKISIVTPSLNQGQFIEETIRSVLLQGYPNLEYIIIDGGSTDDTVEIIKKYSTWLHYWVSEPDLGQSNAINKGFERASGELFAYINSDDFYEPDAFVTVAHAFRSPERPELIIGDCIIFDGSLTKRIFKARWPDRIDHFLKPFGSIFAQPAAFWSRNIYERVRGFDETLHYVLDREFFLKIALTGTKPLILEKPLARYRDHAHTKTTQTINFYYESIPLIEKYAGPSQLNNKDDLLRACRDEIGYLNVFRQWKHRGRFAGLKEFFKLVINRPWLLEKRKILGQLRRLLSFREENVAELRNV